MMLSGLCKTKENLKICSNEEHEKEESSEPDYDQDDDQLEEEQEESTGITSAVTTNQIF